jgi:transposase InsO family protein
MDFKGHFALSNGQRCHPLTVVDDHSRFAVGLRACGDEQTETVRAHLTEIFRLYGLPEEMVMDNGSPWGYGRDREAFTELAVWLIRLGIGVLHSGAGHPQTHGKNERFNRTLQVELLRNGVFRDLEDSQRGFDQWRQEYNLERPHEALGMKTPAECYQPSERSFPDSLGAIEYRPEDIIRKVQWKGEIHFRNRTFLIGRAFHGYPVALRSTREDGIYDVYFSHQNITQINLNNP